MKKRSKLCTLLFIVVLSLTLLAACSKDDDSSSVKEGDATSETSEVNKDTSTKEEEEYTVKIAFVGPATEEACEQVAEEATKIIQKKHNIKIELVRFGYGSFQQEVNLLLASGEKLDLMPNFAFSTSTAASSGQIIALDDLLKEHGKDMLEQISDEDWLCVTINDNIYAVPNNKEKAQGFGIAMSTEILNGMNYDVSKIKTEADLDELFKAVQENYPDVYPLISDGGHMGHTMAARDNLGGDYGVLEPLSDDNTTVVNWYETETYRNSIETRYRWAQEGLIMPDASTNTENAGSLIGAGKGFSCFTNTKPGIEGEWGRKTGKDMTVVELVEPFTTTSGVSNQWFIVNNSEKPEKAMQVLNEMYINEDLANLLVNGVEGVHYVKENGVIDYPEGVDAGNTTYSSVAWAWLNQLITTPWKVDGPNIWEDIIAFNEAAKPSVAKGFMWSNENVLNEITACNNVTAKYVDALESGTLDPAETLPKLIKELEDAGVQNIVAEKQEQLDAWLSQK